MAHSLILVIFLFSFSTGIACNSNEAELFKRDASAVTYRISNNCFNFQSFRDKIGALPRPRNHIYQEKEVAVGHTFIRYIETGMSSHQAILLLHGATFRAELWKNLGTMQYLSDLGFHVVSADLPRHGKSGNPAISKKEYLFHFLKAAKITRPIIIGHSYAGSYIFPFLVGHPRRTKAVILISPTNIRDYITELRQVLIPSLILWGENDEMISVQQSHLLHRALKGSTLKILAEAKHECYNEQKSEFNNQIGLFITGLENDKQLVTN